MARKTTIFLTYLGKTQSAKEWGKELGIDPVYIRSRYCKGLPVEKVLSRVSLIKKSITRRKFNISLEDGIDAWKGVMMSRYGKHFASRFRIQSYRSAGERYRKEITNAALAEMRIAV